MRRAAFILVLPFLLCSVPVLAQLDPLVAKPAASDPLANGTLPAGTVFLFQLEAKFAHDTALGGGKAFAAWFADDGVELPNGAAPVTGHSAIASGANWTPEKYQLTWTPDAGQMNAAGDMGFTWGHYEGRGKDAAGQPVVTKGRYMTVWKKQADGSWKVELDVSNDEPADAGDCCRLPQ